MAKYTTLIRSICEVNAGYDESVGYNSVNEVINKSREKIFNFDFPIFDENYRSVLETKILKHFYTREIGFETVGLWKLHLDTRLNEVMPYYNQLYKSELIQFNPMYDVDLEREHTATGNNTKSESGNTSNTQTQSGNVDNTGSTTNKGTTTSVGSSDTEVSQGGRSEDISITDNTDTIENTNKSKGNNTNTTTGTVEVEAGKVDKYSDTPQGEISNLNSSKYLSNARIIDDDSTTTNDTTVEEINENTTTQTGTNTSKGTGSNINTFNNSSTSSTDDSSTVNTENISNTDSSTTSQSTVAGSTSSNVNASINTLEEYIETVKGKQGGKNFSEMLQDFRNTFLNIDVQVINELNDLFMNIW